MPVMVLLCLALLALGAWIRIKDDDWEVSIAALILTVVVLAFESK